MMVRYSIFEGDLGLKLKQQLWHILKTETPEKDIKERDCLVKAQSILKHGIEEFYGAHLKMDLTGELYGETFD